MDRDTPIDVAGMLTEVGVDAASADPCVSVGDSSILRSERSVELLPQHLPSAAEVSLEAKIGEGETTEVYLGTQRSMRRKVAVRRVHPHRSTPNAPGYVLSEAWMLGAFEHPNILPVYAVAKDTDGLPLVIMKAIETVPWTTILDTPDHPLGCPKHAEPLAFNVQRLISVCSALEHAHHRGCIHRDVKPDNVLIGRDGTVYLHGWELAVALDEDPQGRFPRAADQTQIAGTPAYMAPELATRSAGMVAAATDVYLVGATLHELVTGEPRHVGENVFDAFYSAVASLPFEYGPDVPEELAQILNKAMATHPSDRFQTMAELRHALEGFLRHRPSERLTRHALQAHEEFVRALAAGADDFVVRELFATAYTAYGSARHFWSRNPVVNENLDRAIREMIGYEIAHGMADRAADLLSRLHTPDPALEQRIAQSKELPTIPRVSMPTLTMEQRTIERVRPTQSPEDRRHQVTFISVLVAVWSSYGFAFGAMETFAGTTITNVLLVVVAAVAWVALGGLAVAMRRSLFSEGSASHVIAPMGVIAAASAALLVTGSASVTPHELVVSHILVFFVAMATLNAWLDRRLIVSSATYFVAYIFGAALPEFAFWIIGVSNAIALGFAGYIIHTRTAATSST